MGPWIFACLEQKRARSPFKRRARSSEREDLSPYDMPAGKKKKKTVASVVAMAASLATIVASVVAMATCLRQHAEPMSAQWLPMVTLTKIALAHELSVLLPSFRARMTCFPVIRNIRHGVTTGDHLWP